MLMSFHWHDYIAAFIAGGTVLVFIALLLWNGYDDYLDGRTFNTWRIPHE